MGTPSSSEAHGLRLGVLDIGIPQASAGMARAVEALGYGRYWLSEHHGERGNPSPTLLVPVVAAATTTIRVGVAAVLLQFQSPLAVAENFRVLERLFPRRLDLALGRGGVRADLANALRDGRPDLSASLEAHAERVAEVQRLLRPSLPAEPPLAKAPIDPRLPPGAGPALWVASASPAGSSLAARIGARYTYADAFDPARGPEAIERYLEAFTPSDELAHPEWNVCISGYCAESDADAAAYVKRFPLGEQRHVVGTMSLWREQLEAAAEAYRTSEIVIRTLWTPSNLNGLLRSYARIADVASSIRVRHGRSLETSAA
jgi:luciferase family oxidoreductase group 1